MNENSPIGVFDSGLGGLTVLRALRETLPQETFIYLGDTARLPYGPKAPETVVRYARQVASFLLAREIKYLVVACNTASAHALDHLRSTLPILVEGVIEPCVAPAVEATKTGDIGVLATLGTVRSGAYGNAIQRANAKVRTYTEACPLLVPLAEEGWGGHPVCEQVVGHYLEALRRQCGSIDTLILGCTHYPLLVEAIAKQATQVFGGPIRLIDSANAVARQIAAVLQKERLYASSRTRSDEFFVTDTSRLEELARRFLGTDIGDVKCVDL